MDIETIRKAICANRGGHEQTDDSGIMMLWNSLPAETREQYAKSIAAESDEAAENKKQKRKITSEV